MTPERIRELVLQVWAQQSCRNQDHWPETLAAMMAPGTNRRGSFRPWVDAAVATLGAHLAAGRTLAPDHVWYAFSKLDRVHRARLAELLNDEAGRQEPR